MQMAVKFFLKNTKIAIVPFSIKVSQL